MTTITLTAEETAALEYIIAELRANYLPELVARRYGSISVVLNAGTPVFSASKSVPPSVNIYRVEGLRIVS